jgi:hypothetical protein
VILRPQKYTEFFVPLGLTWSNSADLAKINTNNIILEFFILYPTPIFTKRDLTYQKKLSSSKIQRQEATKENHNPNSNAFIQRVHKIPPEFQVHAIIWKKNVLRRVYIACFRYSS